MKLHRFFIDPSAIHDKDIILSDKDAIGQIRKVLRFDIGDRLIFLDSSGKEYEAVIKLLSNSVIEFEIIKVSENKNEPELKITLYQAICKKDKFEWILQKGTEVGISEFIPVITERTEKLGLNRERAEKILKESAEQSERGIIPKLSEVQNFSETLRQVQGEKIILDKSGEPINKFNLQLITNNLKLFVGPEGGFSESELKFAKENGARVVSLGPRVLRTETAGLVASAILFNK